jgi:hypothetical protein
LSERGIQARVTIEADVNILALSRMLAENGRWLIHVHNRRIVKATKLPPEMPIDEFLNGEAEGSGEFPNREVEGGGESE